MNVQILQYLPIICLFRRICQYFPVYCVTSVQQYMVTYFKRFLSRAMFSISYFRVWFCLSYIKFTTFVSTLINNVCFLDHEVFQRKERFNLTCFTKISKFYFIVSKRFQFVNNTRNLIFVSFAKKNLEANFFSFLE